MKGFYILKGGEVDVGEAPEVISILPLGHVKSSKGEFEVDAESLEAMKQGIAQRGVDLVVDYEHQTLKGVQAPAAGWVKALRMGDGCIEALVEWTETAAKYLKNKEYRYLSPVITVRKSDGKATGLHSLALTNTPAIEGMTPIVNSDNYNEGGQHNMNEFLKKLAELLGLGEDATEADVEAALKACTEENKSLKDKAAQLPEADKIVANKAVCELLGLKAGAPADDVSAKIMELKRKNAERDATDAVELALKGGKITPAQKGWAKEYALDNPEGFKSFVEKAPQIVPLSEVAGDSVALKSDKIDDATLLVCKQLGLSAEDVEKYGKE